MNETKLSNQIKGVTFWFCHFQNGGDGANGNDKNQQKQVIEILRKKDRMLYECSKKRACHLEEINRLNKELDVMKEIKQPELVKEHLEQVIKFLEKYKKSLADIDIEEKIINQTWFTFLNLPLHKRSLLEELYVKQSGWEYVINTFVGSKNILCDNKNEAINTIIDSVVDSLKEGVGSL